MKNQIRFGAVLSYVSIAINILSGLLYTPWMIQQIGKSDYGLYTLANSLITLFLVDFGLSAATARYVSKYVAEGRQDKVENFLGAVYKLYLIVDALIFTVLIVIYFLIETIYVKLTPLELEKFKVVYLIAAMYAVLNFPFITLNGILIAYEKFIQLKLADVIYRILIVVLMAFALLQGFGLYSLVVVNAIVGLFVIIFKLIVIRQTTKCKVNFKKSDSAIYKEIFGFSLWTTITSLAQRLIFNITPSILGILANSAAIAVFGIITTIEGYTYTITTAINGMFMPKISKIYANDEEDSIMPLMLKIGKLQFVLNSLIVVAFFTIGKSFLSLWLGKGYVDAYAGVLLVIIPGMFFNSLQIANTAMIVKNKVKVQAIIAVLSGVVNVILSFFLSKYFGALGASISIFFAYSLRAILYHFAHKNIMKINIFYFIKQCYFKLVPSLIITVILAIILNLIIKENTWLLIVLKAMIISVCYLLFSYVLGFSNQERKNIKSYFNIK